MKKLLKASGFAALCEALIYISAFLYFGLFWQFPYEGAALSQVTYLVDNQAAIALVYFLIYVLFGVVLSVLVIGLHERLKSSNEALTGLASLFGVLWVGLVIASGMISTIGLGATVDLAGVNPDRALEVWWMVSLLTQSLGGGNELVGGLWVFLISLCALRSRAFSKPLNTLGIFVGTAGIATIYPADVLTEIFGISQILWFIWLGITLVNTKSINGKT